MLKTIVLLVTISYPNEGVNVYKFNYMSQAKCEMRGEHLIDLYHSIDEEILVQYDCKSIEELDLV